MAGVAGDEGQGGPTKVMPCQALPPGQILLNNSLGSNASMVSPRQPQHIVAAHAPPSHHCILDGVGERMTQVKGPRHIGGRDDNHKGGFVAVRVWFEEARLLPPVIPGCFDCRRAVALGHVSAHAFLLALRGGLGLLDLLPHLSSVLGLGIDTTHLHHKQGLMIVIEPR